MDLLRLQDVGPEPGADTPDRDTIGLHLSDEDPVESTGPEGKGLRRDVPWLLSSISLHVFIMFALAHLNVWKSRSLPPVTPVQRSAAERVYLPSRARLRELVPPSARKPWHETATPAPPKTTKDRMSIGAPDPRHARELILRPDQDISSVPSAPGAASHAPKAAPSVAPPEDKPQVAQSLPLPVGRGETASGPAGAPKATRQPSLLASVEGIERRWEKEHQGAEGTSAGAVGQQIGALFFDPQGADFTAWINQFTHEVYRNWVMPQAVYLGFRGEVDIEFTVDRDGTMHDVKVLAPSGTVALDRAAVNALLGSRLPPLPKDFGPPEVTMKVAFHYNDGPHRS
jgi:TonB family protein